MNSNKTLSYCILFVALAFADVTASAHRRPYLPHRPSIVVVRPATTIRIVNQLNQKERLAIAIAYLNSNPSLSIKEYARITGLNRQRAEAELDAFAGDKSNPIVLTFEGKKKRYTKE